MGEMVVLSKKWYKDKVIELQDENKRLKESVKELNVHSCCPCGGRLEGLGYNNTTKEVVFECTKCHTQLLLSKGVWEQVLKEK